MIDGRWWYSLPPLPFSPTTSLHGKFLTLKIIRLTGGDKG